MGFSALILVAVLTLGLGTAGAVGLPDTGQQSDYDGSFGRDAAATAGVLVKMGGGAAGFDYTKLGPSGSPLAIQNQNWTYDGSGLDNGTYVAGTRWTCVNDNITGLAWEAHAAGDMNRTYSWYNSDGLHNGGNWGAENGGACTYGRCDTEKFVIDVNAVMFCGHNDWRMPTRRELLTLAHAGAQNPSIDTTYFPNTKASNFWSGTTNVFDSGTAWTVNFSDGATGTFAKSYGAYVILVRGVPF